MTQATPGGRLRVRRLALAVVLVLIGALWVGQGSGAVGGSPMTGSGFWEAVGAVLVVAGAAVGVREVIRPPVPRG